jgi:outer membrane scaffolding protein for murein synthesis (MipA/OmpV family)
MKGRLLLLGALACALAAGPAQARRWLVTVGARVSSNPPYIGADHAVTSGAPTLVVMPFNDFHRFSPPGDGSTFAIVSTQHVSFGPMLRLQRGRDDEEGLPGLRKIDRAIEPGVFVELWPWSWLRARAEVRRGVHGSEGWAGDGGLDLVYSHGRWDASVGPRIGFGDVRYMNTYFGVSAAEAARSPVFNAPYSPGGGHRSTELRGAVTYRFDRHWQASVDFVYERLSSKAADSPIIQIAGSRHQYSEGLSINYSFGVGRSRTREGAN